MIADSHIHTRHSVDSDVLMGDYVQRALRTGVQHLCFTDHVDMNKIDPGYLYYDPRACFEEFWKIKERYSGQINIYSGIEFGEPHIYSENLRRLSSYHYDMIIGSIHFIDKHFASPTLKDEINEREFYKAYWDEMLRMVAHGGFDVLGHVDYHKRCYGRAIYDEKQVETIFKILLDKDAVIEINTSSLRKGYDKLTPDRDILEIYKSVGGQYVTIGSDAHFCCDLAADVDKAKSLIKSVGLQEVVYVDRKKIIIQEQK